MVFKELIVIQNMVDIKWKVNKCCHQNHFCIPVNIISLPDALNFYIQPDSKVLAHFVPLLVSCRPEHLVNSCVLCFGAFEYIYIDICAL